MDREGLRLFLDKLVCPRDERNRIVAIWTAVFYTMAHAFRWFNAAYNHDSLKIFQFDGSWQAYLGRFLTPVYLLFRGKIVAPFLIAMITAVFLVVANVLIVRTLNIKWPIHVILLCAITATCPVVTALFSTFLSATDIHILALLFAALVAYVLFAHKWGWTLAGFFLACSMALYQAYAQVAVTLMLLHIMRTVLTEPESSVVWSEGKRSALALMLGAILYLAGFVIFVKAVYGFSLSQLPSNGAYNSLDGMAGIRLASLPGLVKGLYLSFFDKVVHPAARISGLCGAANVAVAACAFLLIFISDASARRKIVAGLLVLVMPLGAHFVFILSGGIVHSLMFFSFIVLYGGILMLLELKASKAVRALVIASLFFVVLNNIEFSNSLYLRKNLEEKATLSVMSRLLGTIESVEGYKPGETRVAFVGNLNKSLLKQDRRGYPKRILMGDFQSFSTTYFESYHDYFREVLSYPIYLLDRDSTLRFSRLEEVATMPAFPSPGCARMVGDVLVVRLSEDLDMKSSTDFQSSLSGDWRNQRL